MKIMTFKVTFPNEPKVWRRIELKGEQTLADLHSTILRAFGWECEHLYAFFLSGRAWDALTEYRLPEEALLGSPDAWQLEDTQESEKGAAIEAERDVLAPFAGVSDGELDALIAEAAEAMDVSADTLRDMLDQPLDDDGDDRDVRLAQLGEIGLEPGQTFLYLYYFGQEWRFAVQFESQRIGQNLQLLLPRIIEASGDAPTPFDWRDDDDRPDRPHLAADRLPAAR